MNVGFIGVGRLGKDVAEVMAEHHRVTGYDVVYVAIGIPMAGSIKAVVEDKDIVFIAVPTQHQKEYDGREPTSHLKPMDFDYSIVKEVVAEADRHLTKDTIIALISTVLPGTIRREIAPLVQKGRFIYNPYYIAQNTVKWDMRNPEMVLLSTKDGGPSVVYDTMVDFYRPIIENDARHILCTWEEGESIKVFYNTFTTMKICYVNMIQDVAERLGNMNVDVVTKAITGSTYRVISPMYMKAGMGDGGGCHPRDNIALSKLSETLGLGYDFFGNIMYIREAQAEHMAVKLVSYGHDVVILGESFKPDCEFKDGSPGILVGYYVRKHGKKVYYEEAPDDKAYTYLLAHKKGYDDYMFNDGSVVVDPWREMRILMGKVSHVWYGADRVSR